MRLLPVAAATFLAAMIPSALALVARAGTRAPDVASPPSASAPPDVFDAFLAAPYPIADGFRLPTGDGPVRAVAHGRVVQAAKGTIVLEHTYYENHERLQIQSRYVRLSRIDVEPGADIQQGAVLGAVGENPAGTYQLPPRGFIDTHRVLPVPQREPRLLLVSHDRYEMRFYERGVLSAKYEVGFGQAKGRKRHRGDNRTPKGMYFVVQQHRGEFGGEYGAYYGGHWIKVNYPGPWDAQWGVEEGLLTSKQRDRIATRWKARELTPQKTKVGSGIGFHGWNGEWDGAGGAHLSWGCVVMHNDDIAALYDHIEEGTMVVMF